MLHRALLSVTLLVLSCSTSVASAGLLDIDVVDRASGHTLPVHANAGQRYIAGEPGQRYSVRLTNQTGARLLVVLSVDGINAISGETAATSQQGYILDPWQTHDVDGWRKSLDDVARFHFTDPADSYARRTQRPGNIGVIGVAVFNERHMQRPKRPVAVFSPGSAMPEQNRATGSALDSSATPRTEQQIGTGHGEREWAPVTMTRFIRASNRPDEVIELRYDTHASLVARGILPPLPPRYPSPMREPRAFPNGFVADPPGW